MRLVALVAGSLMFFVAVSYFLHERATADIKPGNAISTNLSVDTSNELKKKLS